jgi:hypothetical protein
VNVSSRRPVSADRHRYTGDTLVRFAVVLGGYKFEVTVACCAKDGRVAEVSLAAEDADGTAVDGEGALRLLTAAMAAPRRGGDGELDGRFLETEALAPRTASMASFATGRRWHN